MSRAFVKELDGAAGDNVPELALSPHRNLVTASGLDQLEATLRRLEAELLDARAAEDKALVARIERDQRYFRQRRATAELVSPVGPTAKVRFGCRVRLETEAGELVEFSIVGEDEANPSVGLISYVSPLAGLLIGGAVGDRLQFRDAEAEIVGID
jgi:transcription elongation GreA/GreB family factor